MPTNYIPFRETNYFSKFICDYLEEKPELAKFYNRFPTLSNFKDQIKEKQDNYNHDHRKVLVDVLMKQYGALDASQATIKHIASLLDQDTFTVATGHQLNLFTGPLYFLYKIISTINLCKELSKVYPKQKFVPVFWMASEDHDFAEINYFNFKGKKIQWNSEQSGAVGRFSTEGLDEVFKVIRAEFGSGKHADQLKSWFTEAYLRHSNLADATRYLANALFSEYGLVIIDADHADLKRLYIPQMKAEVLENFAFKNISNTNSELEKLNLKIQVNPREINLFYINDGIRERVIETDGFYSVIDTDKKWSKAELLDELNEFPERFSPNVILRPLYQEVILPNLCYIGGGGEMIYWLQLKSNFDENNVVFPMLLLRNSVLIKTTKQADKLNKLNISDLDLFLDRNTFINKRVRSISNIEIDFSEQIKHLEKQFEALYNLAQLTDTSFLGAVKAQEMKQIKGLKHLEKRLLKAQKRKLKDQIERCTDLQEQLFPNQSLQERNLNFAELYLEFGSNLIPKLVETLEPLKGEFTVLTI